MPCTPLKSGAWSFPEQTYFKNTLLDQLLDGNYPEFDMRSFRGEGIEGLYGKLGVHREVKDEDIISLFKNFCRSQPILKSINVCQSVLQYASGQKDFQLAKLLRDEAFLPDKEKTGWFKPSETYRKGISTLIGTYREAGKKECAIDIPSNLDQCLILANPKPDLVIMHLQNVRKISPEILNWLNNAAKRGLLFPDHLASLKNIPIFEKSEGFLGISDEFFLEEPNLGEYRFVLGQKYREFYPELIKVLKINQKPDVNDWIKVLGEIGRQYQGSSKIPSKTFNVARSCFNQLGQAYERYSENNPDDQPEWVKRLKFERTIPVGTDKEWRRLVYPSDALWNDLPKSWIERYQLDRIQNPFFVVKSNEEGLAEILGIARLSKQKRLTFQNLIGNAHDASRITQKLRTLKSVFLRIAYYAQQKQKINLSELGETISQAKFLLVSDVRVLVEIEGFPSMGRREISLDYGYDPSKKHLFIKSSEPNVCVHALAELMNIDSASLILNLLFVWDKSLVDAQKILDLAHFPELPEQLETDDLSSPVHDPKITPVLSDDNSPSILEEKILLSSETTVNNPNSSAQDSFLSNNSLTTLASNNLKKQNLSSECNYLSQDALLENDSIIDNDAYVNDAHTGIPSKNSGSRSKNHTRQVRFKNYVYVRSADETKVQADAETDTHAREVDRRGMQYVMEFERQQGRTPLDISQDFGAGYDIESHDSDGVVRFIELKTVSGIWGDRGVTLSDNQFLTGQRKSTDYYLYVLEKLDSDPELHLIQDPARKANHFTYSGDWRNLAEESHTLEFDPEN